ncbi:plasmid recombination protein [Butyrivibrio sp. WCD3002]|uniref:plasmid recombination protein n=1 Tax=Butyrivibrio sp. WCD3002 TaxID=1280676 RepID=UPI00041DF707|nr:plasmid recombination protein [Butyrivibrio sp. WCD3002]
MEFLKYKTDSEIVAHIKHDIRALESYGNEDIDSSLSHKNYNLVDRGKTVEEINQYRKDFEASCFKYNRKGLVRSMELIFHKPVDTPPEQEAIFFRACMDWYVSEYLGGCSDAVYGATCHVDERKYVNEVDTITGETKKLLVSKNHLHLSVIPIIPAGSKHPEYKYRLCADQLTKRAVLKSMGPSLQAFLKKRGIDGTVYNPNSESGKIIKLSVKQLKEITNKTGIVIKKSLTVDQLADILRENQQVKIHDKKLVQSLKKAYHKIEIQSQELSRIGILEEQLSQAKSVISALNSNIAISNERNHTLTAENNRLTSELQEKNTAILDLEKALRIKEQSVDHTNNGWGSSGSWGNDNSWSQKQEEEYTW